MIGRHIERLTESNAVAAAFVEQLGQQRPPARQAAPCTVHATEERNIDHEVGDVLVARVVDGALNTFNSSQDIIRRTLNLLGTHDLRERFAEWDEMTLEMRDLSCSSNFSVK